MSRTASIRPRGVGGARQEVREGLDEHRQHLELVAGGGGEDLAPVAVGEVEAVEDALAVGADARLVHVDAAHGERLGEGVEEARCVLRPQVHDGGLGVAAVVDLEVEGPDALDQAPLAL